MGEVTRWRGLQSDRSQLRADSISGGLDRGMINSMGKLRAAPDFDEGRPWAHVSVESLVRIMRALAVFAWNDVSIEQSDRR